MTLLSGDFMSCSHETDRHCWLLAVVDRRHILYIHFFLEASLGGGTGPERSTSLLTIASLLLFIQAWDWHQIVPACSLAPPSDGYWPSFCHASSGYVGRVWPPRDKSLEIHGHERELNPGSRADRPWEGIEPGQQSGQTMSRNWIRAAERTDHEQELNPGSRADRPWETFILPLSYRVSSIKLSDRIKY